MRDIIGVIFHDLPETFPLSPFLLLRDAFAAINHEAAVGDVRL